MPQPVDSSNRWTGWRGGKHTGFMNICSVWAERRALARQRHREQGGQTSHLKLSVTRRSCRERNTLWTQRMSSASRPQRNKKNTKTFIYVTTSVTKAEIKSHQNPRDGASHIWDGSGRKTDGEKGGQSCRLWRDCREKLPLIQWIKQIYFLSFSFDLVQQNSSRPR